MKILIDATMLHKRNGMNLALRNLLRGFAQADSRYAFLVVTTGKGKKHLPRKLQKASIVLPPVPQPLVEQLVLPLLVLFKKCSAFLSFYNTFPLFNFGKKRIVVVHDVIYLHSRKEIPLSSSLSQNIMRVYRCFIVRYFLRVVDRVITVSEFSKGGIVKYTGVDSNLVETVPWAAGDHFFQQGRGVSGTVRGVDLQRIKYFFHLAAIDPRKNTGLVIEQFQRFRRRYSDVKLLLVGRLPSKLQPTVRKDKNIHFFGFVSDRELVALYKNALCLLFPSSYEGFGFPILEAFTSGCPIITTQKSSIPEIAKEAVLYFDLSRSDGFFDKMERIYQDEALREKNVERGYKISREYSWGITTAKYLRLIDSVVT